MSYTYTLDGTLYVNLTNRCTAACEFCLRNRFDTVGDAETLWLDADPTGEQVLDELLSKPWEAGVVFCGYGEPTLRLDEMLYVCRHLKERKPDVRIRVNTNGHANLIHGRDVTPRLKGLVDVLSISLNYPDAAAYYEHCKPSHGADTFNGVLDFARLSREHVPEVILSVVDVLSGEELEACRKIADSLGVGFRVRHDMR